MYLNDADLVSRAKKLISTEIDGDYLSVDADSDSCYTFNAVTLSVWNMLEEAQTFGRLCERLGDSYEVDKGRCRSDVGELLGLLARDGLVRIDAV